MSRKGVEPGRLALAAGTILGLLFSLAPVLAIATTDPFRITVPIDTVVRAPEGSETVLARQAVADDQVGATCLVTARAENQSSVHPGNDLIVSSGASRILLPDVEREPGAVVVAEGTLQLGSEIVVSLIMGPDEVFSGGIEVDIDCAAPDATTTTVEDEVLAAEATTTTVEDEVLAAEVTTTTVEDEVLAAEVTTTTVEDEVLGAEVLPITGAEKVLLTILALALMASGGLALIAARRVTD